MPVCPDSAVLEGLFQGTLAADQRAALERHLDGCQACAQTVSELARLFGSASWGPAAPAGLAGTLSANSFVDGQPSAGSQALAPTEVSASGLTWIEPTHRGASASGSASAHAHAPLELGRYRLGRRLGAGGMGMVFAALDPDLDREVAVKLLHPGMAANAAQTRERLMREAQAMARLAHPNVVAVYDVGRAGEQVFLAMELVEGSTLTQWLAATPRPRTKTILEVFCAAGRGLEAAHAVGLVHRDFKPDNVLVGRDGRARVTDFGLAMPEVIAGQGVESVGSSVAGGVNLRSSMTVPTERGVIVGTPAYMAPEQWLGLPADARSDQFSLCVALYEALHGQRPFAGETMHALSRSVIEGELREPPRVGPRWLREALIRGLAKQPEARHPNMGALLDQLGRKRRRGFELAALVGAMGLSAALAITVSTWGEQPEPRAASEVASEVAGGDPEGAACEAKLAEARGLWKTGRRATVEAHLATMDEGEEVVAGVLPKLDAWAAQWTELAAGTCADDAQAPSTLARCLDAGLARFDALIVQINEHQGFQLDGALPGAVLGLPALERCADPGQLASFPAAPSAEQAARARTVMGEIAAAEALDALHQWSRAREVADHALELAQDLGHAPSLAEAQLVRGQIAAAEYRPELAREWLEAAGETAAGEVHGEVNFEAALALVPELGAKLLRPDDAQRWLRVATREAERRQDARSLGRKALVEGQLLAGLGEYEAARESFEVAARALDDEAGGSEGLRVRLALERAKTLLALAKLDDAAATAERAESLARASFGPRALLVAEALATRAEIALARGMLAQAEPLAVAAAAIPGVGRSMRHDHDHGLYLGLSGEIAWARGEPARAREHFEDAKVYFYAGPEEAWPLLWLGHLDIREGDHEAGLARLERALAKLDPGWPADDPRRLDTLGAIGRAQLEARDHARARATLEAALSLADAAFGFGPRQAYAQVDLGRVELAAGEHERALELFDHSFVGMAGGLDHSHPRVVEVTLTRADLAWELGRREYAGSLYRGVASSLSEQRGSQDPASVRARARQAPAE